MALESVRRGEVALIGRYRARIELLEEELRQAREAEAAARDEAVRAVAMRQWGLSVQLCHALYFLSRRRIVPRRAVSAEIWPDHDPDTLAAERRLGVLLWRLRQAMRPHGIMPPGSAGGRDRMLVWQDDSLAAVRAGFEAAAEAAA